MTLNEVKVALRVTGNADDALLTRLLNSATAECLRFTGLDALDRNTEDDLWNGILVMIHADYDADMKERNEYRRAAETLWMPYRTGMGI
ncbi:MAG TPA: head-tail connector protein [Candidimonas sp.]|nr:head-tail connector protein [Candidimonas sp.]